MKRLASIIFIVAFVLVACDGRKYPCDPLSLKMGAPENEVRSICGEPDRIEIDRTGELFLEQWIYHGYDRFYLYFKGGKLITVQYRGR